MYVQVLRSPCVRTRASVRRNEPALSTHAPGQAVGVRGSFPLGRSAQQLEPQREVVGMLSTAQGQQQDMQTI